MRQSSILSLGPEGFHRVAYTDWGEPDNPHVVMCVHGLSRNSRDFDYLANVLARDYRVVCMDVVGRGESAWLEDKSGYSFSTYLSDAAALIAHVTPPARAGIVNEMRARSLDWVGTSMGGLIGMMLAAKRNSPIGRLVLNDVGPFVPWNGLFRLKGHVGRPRGFGERASAEACLAEACLAEVRPVWDALLAWFSPRRLMWGSDWPVVGLACSYAQWLATAQAFIGELPLDAQAAVWHGTAQRFYSIA